MSNAKKPDYSGQIIDSAEMYEAFCLICEPDQIPNGARGDLDDEGKPVIGQNRPAPVTKGFDF